MALFKFRSLQKRIMVSLLPLVAVLLLILFTVSYFSFKSLIDQEIISKMNYKLDHTGALIENVLNKHSKIAVTLAKTAEVSGLQMTKEQYKSVLKKYVDTNPDTFGSGIWFEPYRYQKNVKYFGPYVYRDKGGMVYTDEYSDPKYDYLNQDWYKIATHTDKQVVWSLPYLDPVTGVTMVTSTAPFYDSQQKLLGVTTADIDLTGLQKMIREMRIGETGRAFLLDQRGFYLAAQDAAKVMKVNIRQDPNQSLAARGDAILRASKGRSEFGGETGRNYLYYAAIPVNGWILGITIPQKELYRPLNNLLIALLAIILVTIGVISWVVIVHSAYITSHLQKVLQFGEQLAQGDISQTIAIETGDEIGAMAKSLQKMAESIREKAVAAEKIAAGDLSVTIEAKSERDILSQSYQNMITMLTYLIAEINRLTQAATAGKLDIRGDIGHLEGGYAQIISGVNQTLDAVIEPIDAVETAIRLMAVNDYTWQIEAEKYQGRFRQLIAESNELKSRFLSIQDAMVKVSQGDTGRLEEARRVGRRSENDQMVPAILALNQNIQLLIDEVERLAQAAVQGDLKVRGNAGRFSGGYQRIIHGFNQTLDAMIEPIHEAAAVLDEMSQGNLQVSVAGNYRGDHAKIKESLNDTIGSFHNVLQDINSTALQVAAGSQQLSAASQVLSQGAAEQASSIEELTASLEEISAQTRLNAGRANEANAITETAQRNAEQGNSQMREMLHAMDAINDASSHISKIIKVIDEIAFQTNILALNAAVEAARAGQHGKGFAVVAEEVRNLAARSADAAKETTTLIEDSIKKVEGGTRIATQTAEALNGIVANIAKVTQLVNGIATASNEQATGIAQINQGIIHVSQVVQTNTATSEESASASEELASQAEMLKRQVSRFKLKKADPSAAPGGRENRRFAAFGNNESSVARNPGSPLYAHQTKTPGSDSLKILLGDNGFDKY